MLLRLYGCIACIFVLAVGASGAPILISYRKADGRSAFHFILRDMRTVGDRRGGRFSYAA